MCDQNSTLPHLKINFYISLLLSKCHTPPTEIYLTKYVRYYKLNTSTQHQFSYRPCNTTSLFGTWRGGEMYQCKFICVRSDAHPLA